MLVEAYKTPKVGLRSHSVTELITGAVKSVGEGAVIAVTSKVVSLSEGYAVAAADADKDGLIIAGSERYLDKATPYGLYLTIRHGLVTVNAGIDESNSDGYYVMFPDDPYACAAKYWAELKAHYGVKNLGLIITDSNDIPLKWGVTGVCLAHCGFEAVNDNRGKEDLFGRKFVFSTVNVACSLAASAVLCMGESAEQTPVAVITDLPFVKFCSGPPTADEIAGQAISVEEDIYGPLLTAAEWKKGGKEPA